MQQTQAPSLELSLKYSCDSKPGLVSGYETLATSPLHIRRYAYAWPPFASPYTSPLPFSKHTAHGILHLRTLVHDTATCLYGCFDFFLL